MLIKRVINILLELGASPDNDAVKLIEFYEDDRVSFVISNQNNFFYKL